MLNIDVFPIHLLTTNCIILTDSETGEAAIVDPGKVNKEIIDFLAKKSITDIKYILLTHGHYDHIGGVEEIQKNYNAKLVIGTHEQEFLKDAKLNLSKFTSRFNIENLHADILLDDNDSVYLGKNKITFIHTPGHTKGSGCYIFDNIMLSGDTLFFEEIGRINLPTGNAQAMIQSLIKLKALDINYKIYPGHGSFTSLNHERCHNHYMINESIV